MRPNDLTHEGVGISVVMLAFLITLMIAHAEIAFAASCLSSTCDLQEHLNSLNHEISKLNCQATQLAGIIQYAANISESIQVKTIRTKQYNKIIKAIEILDEERNIISKYGVAELTKCGGLSSSNPNVCNSRGKCISTDQCVCDSYLFTGSTCNVSRTFKTCKEHYMANSSLPDGVYSIKPFQEKEAFQVWCDMGNGGFTVFQKRVDSTDFYRDWDSYKLGFGSITSSYWLGLDIISKFSNLFNCSLMIRADSSNTAVYPYHFSNYDTFKVDNEVNKYTLHLGSYVSGNMGDSLGYHNEKPFTTKDRDNALSSNVMNQNCAVAFHSGWWYHTCTESNLNGIYQSDSGAGDMFNNCHWKTINDYKYSLKHITMAMLEK